MKSINLTVSKLLIIKITLYILSFLYIYTPPFKIFPFTPSYFVTGFSILYVFAFLRGSFIKFLSKKNVLLLTILCILVISYSVFWDLISKYPKDITLTNSMSVKNILIFLQSFFVPFAFVHILRNKLGYSVYDMLHFFVNIAIIQSFFVILMLLFPSFREFSFLNLMNFSEDSKELHPFLWHIRSFGLSSQYLFAYPIFQGIAIMFAIILSITRSLKYIIPVPLIIVSIIFNARIGFVPIIVFTLVLLLSASFLLKIKTISRIIKLFLIVSIVLILSTILLVRYEFIDTFAKTLQWISSDFESGESQTASILISKHLFFPDSTLGIIFGEGRYLFMNSLETKSSDIGYINNIFFGGFFYVFLITLYLCLISILSYCYTNDFYIRVIIFSIFLTVLIVNIKGFAFQGSSFFNLFLLVNFYIIIDKFYQERKLKVISIVK